MHNKEFKIGDKIQICGNKGIITKIENQYQFKTSYNGKDHGLACFTRESADWLTSMNYKLEPTGKTATYFTVNFVDELYGTQYDNSVYGCLDEFERYSKW